MRIPPVAFTLLFAVLVWQPVQADPIYKWVDSAGQVTYSSTPPPAGAQAEKMEVAPPPTGEEIRQARERAKRVEAQGRELENKRLEQEAAREAEETRLRELQATQPPVVIEKPIVIEKPVYIPQPAYYPPVNERPPGSPPPRPRPVPLPR
jgi:hypothetical protein